MKKPQCSCTSRAFHPIDTNLWCHSVTSNYIMTSRHRPGFCIVELHSCTTFCVRTSNSSAVRAQTHTHTDGTDSVTLTADRGGNNACMDKPISLCGGGSFGVIHVGCWFRFYQPMHLLELGFLLFLQERPSMMSPHSKPESSRGWHTTEVALDRLCDTQAVSGNFS